LKLFKKSILGGAQIGVDRDPSQLEIPQLLQVLSATVIGSRFRAYPQWTPSPVIAAQVASGVDEPVAYGIGCTLLMDDQMVVCS
jgi:hypothetical protein